MTSISTANRTIPIACALLFLSLLVLCAPAPGGAMSVAALPLAGPPLLRTVTRDILRQHYRIMPSDAANAGLFDDSTTMPTFRASAVHDIVRNLDRDMAALRASKWRTWSIDQQIDARYAYAIAQDAKRQVLVERLFEHRPGQWLEQAANEYIALATYAPGRADLRARVTAQLPAMIAEARTLCSRPTQRDVTTATGLIDGMLGTLAASAPSVQRDAARTALQNYERDLKAMRGLPEYRVIGATNYAWRLRHVALLTWTPGALRDLAQRELTQVDAEMAALRARRQGVPPATPAQIALAQSLDREKLLAMYTDVERALFSKLRTLGIVTIPAGVGPIQARETPEAMVPLTGDGGSMNPPPTYGSSNLSYWNVEHFNPAMSPKDRLATVVQTQNFEVTGEGPYAVHEGVPGHHLQLSIARLNPDPMRSVLGDPVQNEGWALYAEDAFQQAGGLGPSVDARYNTLASWRFRVRRVVYDVNVETGIWTLQQAADWKRAAPAGSARVDEDVLRTINWPAQLICYFAGKEQIVALKAAYKRKLGAGYSERRFNDALLGLGSVPYVFARAKLLGERIPDFD